jgi:hypothetical protein
VNYISHHRLLDPRDCGSTLYARRQQNLSFRFPLLAALPLILFWASASLAIPLSEYRQRVQKAIDVLHPLTEKEESQTAAQRAAFVAASVRAARETLPRTDKVEWNGSSFNVDNSWLDDELKNFEKLDDTDPGRAEVLARITERLLGIEERLQEIEKQNSTIGAGKAEMKERLAAVLQRPEYAREAKGRSALGRWLQRFIEWLRRLLPQPKPLSPGRAFRVSRAAQIVVVVFALAVIVFALRLFVPRLARRRKAKKKVKPEARIVLGERLEPDQTAVDLLADAEGLARAGDLRGAIRKGYIALLVELGDRKIISLAQYKTNRDYLRAVREHGPLHQNMQRLTASFEVHWYGLAQASEQDWIAFRTDYREALRG